MQPSEKMSEVIQGKRYSVATATLIAHDYYWDGSNMERNFTNCYLYKTPKGAFFTVNLTQWQGSRDSIMPIDEQTAKDCWEALPEHEVEWAEAFDEEPEDA